MNSAPPRRGRFFRAVPRGAPLPTPARPVAALLATLLLALPAAFAEPTHEADDAAARAQIDAQRQRIETRFAAEQKACFQHFAVNDCRAESQRRRRAELAVLRRDELRLNDAERRRKAAERQHEIDAKAAQRTERAQRAATAPQPGGTESRDRRRDRGPAAARTAEPRPNPPIVPRGQPRADPAERLAREANERSQRASEDQANAARFEREQREAAEHKAAVLRKNAERVKPAAPLPVPPAAVAAPDPR